MSHPFPRALRLLALGLIATASATTRADVRLHPLFTDHAVLQQDRKIHVWGWADPGEKVTVEYAKQVDSVVADKNGRWDAHLNALHASSVGKPLRVVGKNTIELQDVVVGEVWIASGQSNMEWPLDRSFEPQADIEASTNPNLRLFTVVKARSRVPLKNFAEPDKHAWHNSAPEFARGFSAVGYYFGRDLQAAIKVPVGIIHTSWGGSPAEVWMSEDVLRDNHVYERDILRPWAAGQAGYLAQLRQWQAERDAAKAANQPFTKGQPWPGWTPSELYNAMIAPLLGFNVKGAIWYQGESNAGRAWQYRSLYADMIRNWRRDFGTDLPFYCVQLAPWDKSKRRSLEEITREPGESDWAELREAQEVASRAVGNAGVAVITDVGDKDDIHPTKKAPVGARLALLARRGVYHEHRLLAEGPVLQSVKADGTALRLRFLETGSGLKTSDGGPAKGFAIAGKDRKWHWATAEVKGAEVRLSCPDVPKPIAVRYGWADFPVVNLVNSAGLPASPFRTDPWPSITRPK